MNLTKEQRELVEDLRNHLVRMGQIADVHALDALLTAFDAAQTALRDVMPILSECDCIYSDREAPMCPCNAARAAIAATNAQAGEEQSAPEHERADRA